MKKNELIKKVENILLNVMSETDEMDDVIDRLDEVFGEEFVELVNEEREPGGYDGTWHETRYLKITIDNNIHNIAIYAFIADYPENNDYNVFEWKAVPSVKYVMA
jgi:hypothetical protein